MNLEPIVIDVLDAQLTNRAPADLRTGLERLRPAHTTTAEVLADLSATQLVATATLLARYGDRLSRIMAALQDQPYEERWRPGMAQRILNAPAPLRAANELLVADGLEDIQRMIIEEVPVGLELLKAQVAIVLGLFRGIEMVITERDPTAELSLLSALRLLQS